MVMIGLDTAFYGFELHKRNRLKGKRAHAWNAVLARHEKRLAVTEVNWRHHKEWLQNWLVAR